MSRRYSKPRDLSRHAAEVGPEDGGDPQEFHRKAEHSWKQASRKCRQLCAQVKDALHVALAACGDPVLQSLGVSSVEPAPHSGRLRVTLYRDGVELPDAIEAVARAASRLRAAAADAICRRYTPELVFEVM